MNITSTMANTSKRTIYCIKDKNFIKKVFDIMDGDKDGYLDYCEAKAAMRAIGFPVKKSFVVSAMRMYNGRENNKSICFDDFYYVVKEELSRWNALDKLKYAFQCFTANVRGEKITLHDLERINKKLEKNLTKEEMIHMIQEFDLNQDGCVDESEFTKIITELEL